jgi:hypothetical protein
MSAPDQTDVRQAELALYAETVADIAQAVVHHSAAWSSDGLLADGVLYDGQTTVFEHSCDVLHQLGIVDEVERDGRPFQRPSPHAGTCYYKLRIPLDEVAAFVANGSRLHRPSLNRVLAVFAMEADFYDKVSERYGEPFTPNLSPTLFELLVKAGFLTKAGAQVAWTEKARLPLLHGPYPDNYES